MLLRLALALVCFALKPGASAAGQPEQCIQQNLVRCRPAELGVVNVALIGQAYDYEKNVTASVVLRGYIKATRTVTNTTRLFGYAWFDDAEKQGMGGSGPFHARYLKGPSNETVPRITLHSYGERGWDEGVTVDVSITENKVPDGLNFAFRLSATVPSIAATVFELRVAAWSRGTVFSIYDCHAHHGLITPWFNMSAHPHPGHATISGPHRLPNRRELLLYGGTAAPPPPSESPLVLVLFIMHPQLKRNLFIYQAQEILRYVEYHIAQAGMQRILLYIRQHSYMNDPFRDYLATFMPAEVLPYVTFVIWNGPDMEFSSGHYIWDQHYAYYHAATALSGHWNVMASYPDLDEWIAWPKPAKTLHEALARCNTSHLEYLPITSMYTICAPCGEVYNTTFDKGADNLMWTASATPAASAMAQAIISRAPYANNAGAKGINGKHCKWYQEDPLLKYSWSFDDAYGLEVDRQNWTDRLAPGNGEYNGKFIARVQSTKVFIMHRAEMFGDHDQRRRNLDPDTCPYLMHAVNIHGYRGPWTRGDMKWFQKRWRLNWWILPDP